MNDLNAPPNNIEAERGALGSALIDPDAIVKLALTLKPESFYRERHGWIFGAMLSLWKRAEPIDMITLPKELERAGQLSDLGGPAYISGLISSTPTSLNATHYAEIVTNCATLRDLIYKSGKIAEMAYDPNASAQIVKADAYNLLDSVEMQSGAALVPVKDLMMGVVDEIMSGEVPSISSGFYDLDRLIGGFYPSDLIILAARPGMGKSSLALQLAYNAVMDGKTAGFFSLEMGSDQLIKRLISCVARFDSHKMRTGTLSNDDLALLPEIAGALYELPLYIADVPSMSVSDIRAAAMAQRDKLKFLAVDYGQLLSGSGKYKSRVNEVGEISRSLKELARELDIPVVVLCQLNRNVESRIDKRPMLSDLKESGGWEQDADQVIFIYREDYYIEDSDREGIADIIVAKSRHGRPGTIQLGWQAQYTAFCNLELSKQNLN